MKLLRLIVHVDEALEWMRARARARLLRVSKLTSQADHLIPAVRIKEQGSKGASSKQQAANRLTLTCTASTRGKSSSVTCFCAALFPGPNSSSVSGSEKLLFSL